MAGLYPDVPGPRMAYHRDGTVGFRIDAGVANVFGSLINLNDENIGSYWYQYGSSTPAYYHGLIFPELRDVVGIYIGTNNGGTAEGQAPMSALSTSVDTTTGLDGTWVQRIASGFHTNGGGVTHMRTNINTSTMPWTGIRGLRWFQNSLGGGTGRERQTHTCHIYGTLTTGEVRYLSFTDVAGVDVTGAYFDFGDDGRGTSPEDKTFKVKNAHTTLTASSIVLSSVAVTDKSPSFADDYTFSSDGTAFTSTLNIGALAPGVSSGTLYVRRTTPVAATIGLEWPLFIATAGGWA